MESTKDIISRTIKEKAFWSWNNSKLHVQTSESGLHSDCYLNTDRVIADVPLIEKIVGDIFSKELDAREVNPDWIITYPPFGIAIAYALAREVGARFGYVDTKEDICNFDIKKSDKVIVVGDDIYSGGSIKKTIKIMNNIGVKVKSPIFTIGNFSGIKNLEGVEVVSVLSEHGNFYTEKDCPMCKSGSEAILPRQNWANLIKSNEEHKLSGKNL